MDLDDKLKASLKEALEKISVVAVTAPFNEPFSGEFFSEADFAHLGTYSGKDVANVAAKMAEEKMQFILTTLAGDLDDDGSDTMIRTIIRRLLQGRGTIESCNAQRIVAGKDIVADATFKTSISSEQVLLNNNKTIEAPKESGPEDTTWKDFSEV